MQNKPNVLYLSYDGLTDPLGQSQILPYAIGLSAHYAFTLISFEKDERFATGRKGIQALCDQHNIRWVPLRYHKTPPVFSTLYDVWKLRRTAAALHKTSNFKIVHCRSYITALVGLWMKRTLGVKFIFDMRGFWADERVEGGLWNLNNPVFKMVYNFFKKQERSFFKEADHVVSLTQNARQEIQAWGIATSITVIPCCVDLKHFDPGTIQSSMQDRLRKELGLAHDDIVLLYLGSVGTWYLLEDMLIFFDALKQIEAKAKFLFVTPDAPEFGNNQYKGDFIVKASSRDNVPLYISLANLSVMFIKPSYSKKASSATKMAEILAMGIPVVTNSGWGDVLVFQDQLSGFKSISDKTDYTLAIEALLKKQDPLAIRAGAISNFSLSGGVLLYGNIYQDLM